MLVLLAVTETYITHFYHSEGRVAEHDSLSVLLSRNGFEFLIFDAEKKVIREIGHVVLPSSLGEGIVSDANQIEFLLNNFKLDKTRFSKVFVSLLFPEFALLPASFALEATHKQALLFAGGQSGPAATTKHRLGDVDFSYNAPLAVQQLLERSLNNAFIRHAGAVAIELFMSHQALSQCNVFLNLHDGMIELVARKNRELLFYNVFAVETVEDILYFLLFMAEQFQLPAKEMILGIAGGPVEEELLRLVRKFTGHVYLLDEPTSLPLTGKFSALPNYQYFTLLHQHLCEL